MTDQPLSPAAQAIRQINGDLYDQPVLSVIAAAIRAMADHVAPMDVSVGGGFRMHRSAAAQRRAIRSAILAIAAELEGADG